MRLIRNPDHLARLWVLCLAAAALVAACGDDDTTAPPGGGAPPASPKASFVDCWVEGLEYTTDTASGLTGEFGIFACALGDSVAFHVGDIALGNGVAGPYMNPIEIAYATDIFEYEPTNIARFLLTIDDDGDPSNGMQIVAAVRAAAVGKTLDFDQYPGTFAADANVQQVISDLTAVTTAGTRPLVGETIARTHLTFTLFAVLAGLYGGPFTGSKGGDDWEGRWFLQVAANGDIIGEFSPDMAATVVMSGIMQPSGSFSCMDQTGMGLMFTGRIVRGEDGLHDVTGAWTDYEQGSGTFSGDRPHYPDEIVCP